jgi:hypothetical protein
MAAGSHEPRRRVTIVSINQPCYLPWCGLIERIARADVHVHLDDVQYSKSTFFARNRVVDRAGREVMLVVPVRAQLHDTIQQATVPDDGWRRKHLASLTQIYGRFPGATAKLDELKTLYAKPCASLADLNIETIGWLLKALGITTPTVRASELGVDGKATSRVVALCKHLGGTEYYSPSGAREYIQAEEFEAAGVKLTYQAYTPVPYEQAPLPEFVPFLSVVDPLLRHGGEATRAVVLAGAT